MSKAVFRLWPILLVIASACSERVPPPQVEANGEPLQGLWEGENGDIAVFRGVPFAAPPVGELRWRAPVPNAPRKGRQDATEFAPACMQDGYATERYARIRTAFGQSAKEAPEPLGVSEDCLYLNIWTPQLEATAKLPVVVWVHGGDNRSGWSYQPEVLGDRLAARGVVIVSIAYRLGPFGFFSHPLLGDAAGEPVANFGLLDIRQAFRWVRWNIRSFGGDPEKITAFGASSGAGNLLDLSLAGSDEEQLFRRLVIASAGGLAARRRSLEQEQMIGENLVEALGLTGDLTVARLRDIPARDLLEASSTVLSGHSFNGVLDGQILSGQLPDALLAGKAGRLEVLIGTNAGEQYMQLDPAITVEEVRQWIRREAPEFAASLQSAVEDEGDPRKAQDRLLTAREILCPSRLVAAEVSAQGGQAYAYFFSRVWSGEGGSALGTYQGAELPFVFDTHPGWLTTSAADRELTDSMMDYWVRFATSGDPNIKGRPGWPIYVAGRPYVMELGAKIRVMEANDAALCRYLGPRRLQ